MHGLRMLVCDEAGAEAEEARAESLAEELQQLKSKCGCCVVYITRLIYACGG